MGNLHGVPVVISSKPSVKKRNDEKEAGGGCVSWFVCSLIELVSVDDVDRRYLAAVNRHWPAARSPGHRARQSQKVGGGAAAVEIKVNKGIPYSITERKVPELIPILGSQPAGDVSHKPGGRLP